VCFIVVPVNELLSREREYIEKFNPPYNRTLVEKLPAPSLQS
jgi:hypothetical protein